VVLGAARQPGGEGGNTQQALNITCIVERDGQGALLEADERDPVACSESLKSPSTP
jgi:hypothetical protein